MAQVQKSDELTSDSGAPLHVALACQAVFLFAVYFHSFSLFPGQLMTWHTCRYIA